MTALAECGWACVRGTAVAAVAIAVARPLLALVANAPAMRRRVLWGLLVAPFLTPVVLVGYSWSNFSLSLVQHPAWNEALYSALLLARLAPVAALALWFAPTYLSREAVHCRRLLKIRDATRFRGAGNRVASLISSAESRTFLVHGPALKYAVAFVLVFLFAFGDFEMASLMNIRTWTVRLFDAQAGGLALGESLKLAAAPLACEATLLLAAMAMLFGGKVSARLAPERPAPAGPRARVFAWAYLVSAAVLATGIPLAVVLKGTASGFRVLAGSRALDRDILSGVLVAAGAAGAVFILSWWLVRRGSKSAGSPGKFAASVALSVPGLLGALLLGLLVLTLFQLPLLRGAYDTPAPLMIALALLIFPPGILLMALLNAARSAERLHCAQLLADSPAAEVRGHARALAWEMRTRSLLFAAALLFFWAYFEVVASSMLAPSDMTPVFVRLYNLMHYGQIAGLSAMVCVAMVVPAALVALGVAAGRTLSGRIRHG